MSTSVVLVDAKEETVSTAITCSQCDLQAATLRERVRPTSITLPPDLATTTAQINDKGLLNIINEGF